MHVELEGGRSYELGARHLKSVVDDVHQYCTNGNHPPPTALRIIMSAQQSPGLDLRTTQFTVILWRQNYRPVSIVWRIVTTFGPPVTVLPYLCVGFTCFASWLNGAVRITSNVFHHVSGGKDKLPQNNSNGGHLHTTSPRCERQKNTSTYLRFGGILPGILDGSRTGQKRPALGTR